MPDSAWEGKLHTAKEEKNQGEFNRKSLEKNQELSSYAKDFKETMFVRIHNANLKEWKKKKPKI